MGTPRCSYMTYKIGHDPGTAFVPHTFEFVEPATLTIRRRDGKVEKLTFGMTERIEILQPGVHWLNVPHEQWDTIPMPNGDQIVEWPADLRMRMITGLVSEWTRDLPGR